MLLTLTLRLIKVDRILYPFKKIRRRLYSSTHTNDKQLPLPLPYSITFFGGDSFSIPSLERLLHLSSKGSLSLVVSNVNNVVGKFAKKNEVKCIVWEEYKDKDEGGGDLGVVASFGFLIPKRVIDRFRL